MKYGYSILMFCLAGGLLLYAAVMSATGDAGMIRRAYAAKMRNPKDYAKKFAKVLALVSLSPLVSGGVGLLFDIDRYPLLPPVALIVTFILCMRRGVRLMDDGDASEDTHQMPDADRRE